MPSTATTPATSPRSGSPRGVMRPTSSTSSTCDRTRDGRYRSVVPCCDHRRPVVEGSQILGQSIVAASRHAPGRRVVSASMIFARAADARAPYEIGLEPVTGGRTFTALRAEATQNERTCAFGTLLLDTTAPDLIRHAEEAPRVPGPYESTPFDMSVTGRDLRIVDDAYTGDPDAPIGEPELGAWVRFRQVPDDPPIHAGLLAQFTGHLSIAAALRPHAGIGQDQAHRTISTAINAISLSIHANVRADRWMLYHHRSTFAGDGMTHSECRVYDEHSEPRRLLHRRCDGPCLRRSHRIGRRPDGDVTLTSARGPLGPDPAGRFSPPIAPGTVYVEPHLRRIEAVVDGRTVLDTEAALIVHRPGHPVAYAFPADQVGDLPHEPEPEAQGYVRVPWDAVDAWFEEGRRLVHYPPNPYHRIDCRPTRRHLRVEVAGTTLVDTSDTIILFETALGTEALRRSGGGPNRSPAPQRHHHLLQLQGRLHLLVGHDRRHRGGRRGVELRGPVPREHAHQGLPQLRPGARGGPRRAALMHCSPQTPMPAASFCFFHSARDMRVTSTSAARHGPGAHRRWRPRGPCARTGPSRRTGRRSPR